MLDPQLISILSRLQEDPVRAYMEIEEYINGRIKRGFDNGYRQGEREGYINGYESCFKMALRETMKNQKQQ